MDPNSQYERIEAVVRSVEAPAALRERIAAERDRTLIRRMVVKRMKLTGALAGAAAVLGIAVGLLSLAGRSDDPSSLDAARLASLQPVAAAPATDRSHPKLLEAKVDHVTFPAWADRYPWEASGQRADELDGRDTLTVFYDNPDGVRLGYTVVAGDALAWPEGADSVVRNAVEVRVMKRDGRVLAFWRVHGQTCIISAPDSVPVERVVALAAYDAYA
jgi:hypothetical protein